MQSQSEKQLLEVLERIAKSLEKITECVIPEKYADGSRVFQTFPCDVHPEEGKSNVVEPE